MIGMLDITVTEAQVWAVAVACVMMLLDVVVGFAGSLMTGTFDSSKMRVGLGHKMLLMCIIFMAFVIETAGSHIAGLEFSGVTVVVVCVYIIVMEVGSVMENIAIAYPEIKDTPLFRVFKNVNEGEE